MALGGAGKVWSESDRHGYGRRQPHAMIICEGQRPDLAGPMPSGTRIGRRCIRRCQNRSLGRQVPIRGARSGRACGTVGYSRDRRLVKARPQASRRGRASFAMRNREGLRTGTGPFLGAAPSRNPSAYGRTRSRRRRTMSWAFWRPMSPQRGRRHQCCRLDTRRRDARSIAGRRPT